MLGRVPSTRADKQEPVSALSVAAGFSDSKVQKVEMESYVRQRIAEIKADSPRPRQPVKPLSFRDQAVAVARWLTLLGNGNRFLAVVHLIDGEKTVGELAALIGLSASAASQHLALLAEERIVQSRLDGARHYYSCKSEAAKAVVEFLDGLAMEKKLPKGFLSRAS